MKGTIMCRIFPTDTNPEFIEADHAACALYQEVSELHDAAVKVRDAGGEAAALAAFEAINYEFARMSLRKASRTSTLEAHQEAVNEARQSIKTAEDLRDQRLAKSSV